MSSLSSSLPHPGQKMRSRSSRDRGGPSAPSTSQTPTTKYVDPAAPAVSVTYRDGSPKSLAATPKSTNRSMDPFEAGKAAQQFQQHEQQYEYEQLPSSTPKSSGAAGMSGSVEKQEQPQSQSLESMTPRTTMRQAPVGNLGVTTLPPTGTSGAQTKETTADLLRGFQRKSVDTVPGGAQASQEVPFSDKNKKADGSPAPPPTFTMSKGSPIRSASSAVAAINPSLAKSAASQVKGETQVVSGVPPKVRRSKKRRPAEPTSMTLPRHSGRYEAFLRCVNGTLNFFIFLTLLIMAVVALSAHSDKIPEVNLSSLGPYLSGLWPGGGSEL